jgi:hypothetical protein
MENWDENEPCVDNLAMKHGDFQVPYVELPKAMVLKMRDLHH